LGAALAHTLLERGWLVRVAGNRAVRLTEQGRAGLRQELHIEVVTS
jgi:hypothetical protein